MGDLTEDDLQDLRVCIRSVIPADYAGFPKFKK